MKYDAVIFDFDGVLIDSEPAHIQSLTAMLANHGIHLTDEQIGQQTGITTPHFLDIVVNEWGYPGPKPGEDWVQEKRELFHQAAADGLKPIPGAGELLRALQGRVRLGLASSSSRGYVERYVRQLGWEGMFDAVCSVNDVQRPKPDPAIFTLAVERLGVDHGNALVFEDSPVGVEAAVAAGLDCAALTTSYPADRLRESGAQWILRDFTDREAVSRLLGLPAEAY